MNLLRTISVACLLAAGGALAQETDVDGRRWYEVEVVVFTHEGLAGQITERPLADPTRLDWLPRLRLLQPAAASLAYPFGPVPPAAVPQELSSTLPLPLAAEASSGPVQPELEPEPVFGPQPAPPAQRGFRLADTRRDPFIALETSSALLTQDARLLENAEEHRVLWHRAWRQPMLPAGQAAAVLVLGGDPYGERHEVEGSLRFSDSGGQVQLDAHLWFSSFLAGFASEGTAWTLPKLPELAVAIDAGDGLEATQLGSWISSGAWQLQDRLLLAANSFFYLDNPAIGVLLQIRPYVVPPLELPAQPEDF